MTTIIGPRPGEPDITLTITAPAPVVPPVDPPPVEPPPNSKTVRPGAWSQKFLDGLSDGDVVLLYGGEYNTPFYILRKKVTLQNMPGEEANITRTGRPDMLYHETAGVVRGLKFRSQSTGFDDTGGAALCEVRSPTVAIDLVWYDGNEFHGTAKMAAREQLVYIADKGKPIAEVRFTGNLFDGHGSNGYGIHPYSGPSPKLITSTGDTFQNLDTNAAILNAASACLVKADHDTFIACVTYARGMYGPVQVSNSKLSGNAIGTVQDMGNNTR